MYQSEDKLIVLYFCSYPDSIFSLSCPDQTNDSFFSTVSSRESSSRRGFMGICFFFVSFTNSILIPPAMQTNPPINTPFTPISSAMVTKNGETIFPTLDIASETPVPVDLMEVGNDQVVIRLKRANPKVLNNLLMPINAISRLELSTTNWSIIPMTPAEIIKIRIHLFRYILSQ